MNLQLIQDQLLWSPLHYLQCVEDQLIADSYCPHYKDGKGWKNDYKSLADVDKWFQAHKHQMLSGEWSNTTAAYYCPKCNSWHTTTSQFDADEVSKWQQADYKECQRQGLPLTNAPKEGEPWYKLYLPCNSGKTTEARNRAKDRREQRSRERLKRDQDLKELIRKVNPGIVI